MPHQRFLRRPWQLTKSLPLFRPAWTHEQSDQVPWSDWYWLLAVYSPTHHHHHQQPAARAARGEWGRGVGKESMGVGRGSDHLDDPYCTDVFTIIYEEVTIKFLTEPRERNEEWKRATRRRSLRLMTLVAGLIDVNWNTSRSPTANQAWWFYPLSLIDLGSTVTNTPYVVLINSWNWMDRLLQLIMRLTPVWPPSSIYPEALTMFYVS